MSKRNVLFDFISRLVMGTCDVRLVHYRRKTSDAIVIISVYYLIVSCVRVILHEHARTSRLFVLCARILVLSISLFFSFFFSSKNCASICVFHSILANYIF